MKNFLHGMGGGVGRGIGRAIGYIVVGFLIYLLINFLHVDVKNDLINKILFLDVHARTIEADVTNSLSIPTSYSGCTQSNGYFWGDDGSSSICHTHAVKSTISGVLYSLEMVLKNAWLTNQMAFVNITGMSSDFRNNNLYCTITNASGTSLPCTLSFNSKSSLTVSFIPNITGNYTLGIYSSTYDAITGINTYGIRKVVITQSQGDNSDVIDSANQNSQNEINNANQNAQDIINNQNQNTQDIINSNDRNSMAELNNQRTAANSSCKNYYNAEIKYGKKTLTNQGVLTDSNNYSYYTEQYINIDIISSTYGDRLGIKNPAQAVSGYRFILYDSNFNFISTTNLANRNVVIPSNAQYFRFASPVANTYIFRGGNCVTSSDETNDLMKDDSVDQSQANNFFTDFSDNDFGLSQIITLPLSTIQSLTSTSCVALELPVPFTNNQKITLPCMSQVYQDRIPTLYNAWKVVSFGLVAYWIATDIFKLVKGFKDPEEDKVEVMDL